MGLSAPAASLSRRPLMESIGCSVKDKVMFNSTCHATFMHCSRYTEQNAPLIQSPRNPKQPTFSSHLLIHSCRGLESIRKATNIINQLPLVAEKLNVGTIDVDLPLGTFSDIFVPTESCKAPILRNDDLLATRKLS